MNFALDKGIQCLLYWLGYKRYLGGFGGSKCENAIRDELQQNILPCLLDSDYVVLKVWMIKQENQNIKTYLLVISEIGLPTEYVNPVTGKVLGKGKIYLIDNQYKYKVKRVASLVDHKVNEKDLIVPENALEKLFSKGLMLA